MTFIEKLESRVKSANSLLCVGLDPHPETLPEPTAAAAQAYCEKIITATAQYAAAFKPNSAFFEQFGAPGMAALAAVIRAVPTEIPVILDAKRGDITSTATAYASAAFDTLGADAVTINPYLGRDSINPFLENVAKGAFLLCRTSNAGGADLQELQLSTGGLLYEQVAELAQRWNTHGNLGLVVGATQPEALARVRAVAPELWMLVPGVGAQGGDLHATLAAGLRPDGMGLLINASRSIANADDPAQAARTLRDDINASRKSNETQPEHFSPLKQRIADGLLSSGCVKFGAFKLKSGETSPIYIDLRRLVAFPALMTDVARAFRGILKQLEFQHLGALPYAALPIATAISLQGGWSMLYPRKEVKDYGTQVPVEGVYAQGDRVVVIDDLVSTGGSKFESIKKLEAVDLEVRDIVVLIDRQKQGQAIFKHTPYTLHSVFSIAGLLDYWYTNGAISREQGRQLAEFGLWDVP
ncbi:MAG: orotidine-5'-phosphate decarboxylase [Lentisphaeria bacterium]|nr:orotidine-5'-phosphate decarboxylase [Candidatus Neomarinimicrobiota bacterium]MCF7843084.1 orotidine-5'-phosphate decarboxylase [Lentisphaeria bacterium]